MTLMVLQQCQCSENKVAFNQLVKIEQDLSVVQTIKNSLLICSEGKKIEVIQQIIRVIEFFLKATGKEMEVFQIQILASDLYDKFRTYTLDDVVLMFKMARQGEFGKVYRLDSLEIMEWANKYLNVKSAAREKMITQKKEKNVKKMRESFSMNCHKIYKISSIKWINLRLNKLF